MNIKKVILHVLIVFLFASSSTAFAQTSKWLTSLEMAQVLARRQNKMILMVWKESTEYPLPVVAKDEKGSLIYVEDLFNAPEINELLWKYFVLVRIDDDRYADLFSKVDGKRSSQYISTFQDDALKVMDANGNLLLMSEIANEEFLYLGVLINKYALDTTYISKELNAYASNKDFFSAYYLASKYIDYCIFLNKNIRDEVIELSSVYISEALTLLSTVEDDKKVGFQEQVQLLPLKQDLVLGKAKKVIRKLSKLDTTQYKKSSLSEVAFLYYTAYRILDNEKRASAWKSQVSSVNLKKAELISNINK